MEGLSMSDALAFYELLFGRCTPADGEVVVCHPVKLKDRTTFRTIELCRPDDPSKIIRRGHSVKDSYHKMTLFSGALRKRIYASMWGVGSLAECQTITSFYADADAGKPGYLTREAMLRVLYEMPVPPSAIINSNGPDGGFHAYWCLKQPFRLRHDADRQYVAKLLNRWQERLRELAGGSLDSTQNLDRMLRFVGSQRSNGNAVTVHELSEDRLYSLDELSLPADYQRLTEQAAKRAKTIVSKALLQYEDTERPVSDYLQWRSETVDSLLDRHGFTPLGPDQWVRSESVSGGKTFARATEGGRVGVCAFSGNETRFPPMQANGKIGKFYSLLDMFVRLEHGGDWKKAAAWCRDQLNTANGTDLTEFLKSCK
jgi:hypothetical protein